jgi:hypothetical protein
MEKSGACKDMVVKYVGEHMSQLALRKEAKKIINNDQHNVPESTSLQTVEDASAVNTPQG